MLADGKIYITDEDGVTIVIRSGPKFELLSGKRSAGDYTLSSPAVSDGQIRPDGFVHWRDRRRQAAARSTPVAVEIGVAAGF